MTPTTNINNRSDANNYPSPDKPGLLEGRVDISDDFRKKLLEAIKMTIQRRNSDRELKKSGNRKPKKYTLATLNKELKLRPQLLWCIENTRLASVPDHQFNILNQFVDGTLPSKKQTDLVVGQQSNEQRQGEESNLVVGQQSNEQRQRKNPENSPASRINMNPVYQRRTDEEIFKEEGLERSLKCTKDLEKDVEIAFYIRLKKMRLQNNSLWINDAAVLMTTEMKICSPTFLSTLLWNSSGARKVIPEPDLKKMQIFFNSELSPEIRKQLTTLFPVEKEKFTVVAVKPIPSLLKDIKKIIEDSRRLKSGLPLSQISPETGLNTKALSKILNNDFSFFKNSLFRREQIEKIRSFAQKNLKNVENEYPILFSEKLLEIDNNTLSVSSAALHSAPLIQTSVISNNASEMPSNKRPFNQIKPSQEKLPASLSPLLSDDSFLMNQNKGTVPKKGGNTLFTPPLPRFASLIEGLPPTTVLSNDNPPNFTSSSSAPQKKTSVDNSLRKEAPPHSLKRQKVNKTPSISSETSSIPLQISQKNDNITEESLSVFTPRIGKSMEVEIVPEWKGRVAEFEHPELFEDLWNNNDNITTESSSVFTPRIDKSMEVEIVPEWKGRVAEFEHPELFEDLWNNNDNITTESSSVFTPRIDKSMEVEIVPEWEGRVAEFEHPELFKDLWET